MSRLLTMTDSMDYLRLSKSTLHRLVRAGRRTIPVRGSLDSRLAGNTYCQIQRRSAHGYFRSRANGR